MSHRNAGSLANSDEPQAIIRSRRELRAASSGLRGAHKVPCMSAHQVKISILAAALLILGGCASISRSDAIGMPTPSSGDTEGQIMSVTGAGFTICDVNHDGPQHYDVTVCGSVRNARAALEPRFSGRYTLQAYQPDDGGPHTAKEMVMQWWINRITGSGFVITSTQIMDDGTIDVGVDGDLKAAKAALDREFPGWTRAHTQPASVPLVFKT
jgi:hypothetical protein